MDRDNTNISGYATALRRRWRIIAFVVVVAIGASVAVMLSQTPVYQGTASVLIESTSGATDSTGVVIDPDEVATQAQVVTSLPVASRVVSSLGLSESPTDLLGDVSVAVNGTRVLDISAVQDNAAEAATVANAFANAYLGYRQDNVTRQRVASRDALKQQFIKLQAELNRVQAKIASASGRSKQSLVAQQQSLLIQRGQVTADLAGLTDAAAQVSGGEVLLPATPPSSPTAPTPLRTEGLVGILALIVGVALALLRDRFDDVIHDEETVQEAVPDKVLLGQIPQWPQKAGPVASFSAPRSPVSEAYRSVGTNVRFLLAALPSVDGRGRVLLITSPAAGEGKTSISSNLAIAAARLGLRVVLVDADLRNPRLAGIFGLPSSSGLSNLLVSEDESAKAYLMDVGVEGLAVLPAGTPPPNPAELTGSGRMQTVLEEVALGTDLVILDSAPVLPVADTVALLPMVDLVVMVCRSRLSQRRSLRAAVNRIEQVGVRVAGLILNDVDASKAPEYALVGVSQGR